MSVTYDIDSFDEVEATEGDFHTISTSELSAALSEAELAISKVSMNTRQ